MVSGTLNEKFNTDSAIIFEKFCCPMVWRSYEKLQSADFLRQSRRSSALFHFETVYRRDFVE